MLKPDKQPQAVILVTCSSFSPITFLHLRMFVMTYDHAKQDTDFEIMGNFINAASNVHKKLEGSVSRAQFTSLSAQPQR